MWFHHHYARLWSIARRGISRTPGKKVGVLADICAKIVKDSLVRVVRCHHRSGAKNGGSQGGQASGGAEFENGTMTGLHVGLWGSLLEIEGECEGSIPDVIGLHDTTTSVRPNDASRLRGQGGMVDGMGTGRLGEICMQCH